MIEKALFIHGLQGHPEENWFPWLKKELEREGIEVIIPQFPTPEGQSLETWFEVFDRYKDQLTHNTIVVAHSMGVSFALTLLEQFKAEAAFLIAGCVGRMENEFDDIVADFVSRVFDEEAIRRNCPRFSVIHSDNDPYHTQVDMAGRIATLVGVEPEIIRNGAHLNEDAGYTEFPLLRDRILKTSKTSDH
jgi:predicted alpha/beta hydrolase family esterase